LGSFASKWNSAQCQASAFAPRRFVRGKEYETVLKAPLHFHYMGDDVDGTGMAGIECQRAPRYFFGAAILPVFFEGEGVHRKHAGVAWHFGCPLR
jgi:hypothetical protein